MFVVALCYYILEKKRRLIKFALYIFVWLVVFNIRGREFGMSSKFELKKFAIQTSVEQLDICRKDDLFSIADLYQIKVPRGTVK